MSRLKQLRELLVEKRKAAAACLSDDIRPTTKTRAGYDALIVEVVEIEQDIERIERADRIGAELAARSDTPYKPIGRPLEEGL